MSRGLPAPPSWGKPLIGALDHKTLRNTRIKRDSSCVSKNLTYTVLTRSYHKFSCNLTLSYL